MTKNHPITILGIEPNGHLILSDRGVTTTQPGDRVTWLIHPGSGVTKINAIVNLSMPVDVFSPNDPPRPVGQSVNWQGTINPDIQTLMEEEYCIHYTKTDGTTNNSDPKIIVNP